jgi:anion transporter
VLAIAVLAIILWCSDAIPAAVTGLILVLGLVLTGGVPGFREALSGFAEPVAYFLVGVLTIGLAVQRSGLAERVARHFLQRSRGSARALYGHLLLAFPLLTLILPSATTRTGILVHVYEEALALAQVPRRHPLAGAIMLALSSINRLASTLLLTGGITPMVSAALIGKGMEERGMGGGIGWSRWLLLMSVPYLALLVVGALLIYGLQRRGFALALPPLPEVKRPLDGRQWRVIAIAGGASLLWLTDALHHLNPAAAALLAWILLLMPRVGVLSWQEFERNIGWTSFFVLASSLSLASALVASGASAWLAQCIVQATPRLSDSAVGVIAVLLAAAVPVRLLIPNITGFLAITIPIAMSIGAAAGVNPVICALAVMIAGDAVLYYPAQSASSLVICERGYLTAPQIFRFGVWMTLAAFAVVLLVALPYWTAVGEPLRIR